MISSFEERVLELGIDLPVPPASVANYVATYRAGTLLVVSGQLCMDSSANLVARGRVEEDITIEEAVRAARTCGINVLAQVRSALGSLDQVKQIVRLGGFIAASPDFREHARIMNGASDLMVEVFGEQGRHTRSTVGVASLPFQASVEVEAIIEIV